MGRRGNPAERDCARRDRHARRRRHFVGPRPQDVDREYGPDARRVSRLARTACGIRGLVRKSGKRTDDWTNPLCGRRLRVFDARRAFMVRVADFRLTKAAAHVRAHGVKGSRELVVNFIQPLQSRVPRPMRDFLKALTRLLFDFASTIVFLVLYLLTHNTILSVGLGIAFSLAQTGTQFIRRKPIGTMEWLSLFLVIASGTATLLTDDP